MKKIVLISLLLALRVLSYSQLYPDVYYRLNATGLGTDTLVEDVFNNYDAVYQKNYTWRHSSGKYEGALKFDGTTEVILAPQDTDHIFNEGYCEKTVAMWIKADDPSANGMLYYDGPGNHNMGIRLLDGNLEGVVSAGDSPFAPTMKVVKAPFTSTDWAHVALVFDHGLIQLYLNGEVAASGSLGKDSVISLQKPPARLGHKTSGWSPFRDNGISAGAVYNFSGLLDEFMLLMDGLDSAAIAEVMKGDTTTVRPAAPAGPVATAESYKAIKLDWDDQVTNEAGFRILARTESGEFYAAGEVPADSSGFVHEDLTGSTTYYYKVYAFNLIGNSDTTAEFSATTLAPPPPPVAPTGFTATVANFRQIDLEWTDNADNEEEYRILVSINNGPYELAASLPPNSESFVHGELHPENKYTYRLFAWNGGGSSDTTDAVNVTTPAQPVLTGIDFPYDAGMINVKEHGVVGDGVTDDTKAIQEILNEYRGIIYFPEGTYMISDTLVWTKEARSVTFQGQGKDLTTIMLADNSPKFQNPDNPYALIWTGKAPAQRFRNYIRDMTINTGTGNPGAIGLQFIANNAGGIIDVDIVSGDGDGVIGLDLGYTNEQGPCLIKNVRISGFNTGIKTKYSVNSITLEHVTLENQKLAGIVNDGQVVNIRNLVSNNSAIAFMNTGTGVATLVDCSFTGGSQDNPAIYNSATLFVRNLHTDGYQQAIQNLAGNQYSEEGPDVEEYVSHKAYTLFPVEERSLNLPIEETPEVPWDNDFHNWISVVKCGAIPDDGNDDTEAIQAAMDSGRTTVYFPKGQYHINGTVEIRGDVRRIIGMESNVQVPQQLEPAFKLVDGTHDVVVFERFAHFGYNFHYTLDNASTRTLVVKNASAISGNITGTGDVFIEDIVSNINSQWVFGDHNTWARQLNIESRNGLTHLVNNGGKLWVLGYKTEQYGVLLENKNNAQAEILGSFVYSVGEAYPGPMVVNENSDLTFIMGEAHYAGDPYDTLVLETKNGESAVLMNTSVPRRGAASIIPLFSARSSENIVLEAPENLMATSMSGKKISLTWEENITTETGFSIERRLAGGNFAEIGTVDANVTAYTDTGLVAGTEYIYRVRGYSDDGYSPYTNEASAEAVEVGIDISDATGKIKIYPNPASEILYISLESADLDVNKIELKNILGKTVLSVKGSGSIMYKMQLQHIEAGIYFVTISGKEQQVTRRIMIQ